MVAKVISEAIQNLRVEKDIFIAAPLEIAFESLLEQLGPENEVVGGKAMPMVLEPWPGGRWYRDLGKHNFGGHGGHFWGHVQVIKPPALIEISGPLFMSYPGVNHLQYRLTAEGTGTRLHLLHRGFGEIPAEHRDGVNEGWAHMLAIVQRLAEAKAQAK
ncbi:SRPBCC domain-containing protein [Anatilimnocola sp. NA78]|uniref:SRPBCC family protein n=1 Tax=Anatilimnocola sp. NA78 TaxID=3415683 RepID=UPI003CE5AF67